MSYASSNKYNVLHMNTWQSFWQAGPNGIAVAYSAGLAQLRRERPEQSYCVSDPDIASKYGMMFRCGFTDRYNGNLPEIMMHMTLPQMGAGCAVSDDGELQGLWSLKSGYGQRMVRHAIEMGATWLNCFNTKPLRELYAANGFEITAIMPFDTKRASVHHRACDPRPEVLTMRRA